MNPRAPHELQVQVNQKVNECLAKLEMHYGRTFPRPVNRFDLHSSRKIGEAHAGKNKLRWNPACLIGNPKAYLNEVVPHEVAHLVAYYLNGNRQLTKYKGGRIVSDAHGPKWKSVMRVLGVRAASTTSAFSGILSDKKRTMNRYEYVCKGCGADVNLSARAHGKLLQNPEHFYHTGCKGHRLVLKGSTGIKITRTGMDPTPTAPKAPKPMATEVRDKLLKDLMARGMNKKDLARTFVQDLQQQGASRSVIIQYLMDTLGMSKAGASTYYYNAKKELGA